jgi:hypothetical protein
MHHNYIKQNLASSRHTCIRQYSILPHSREHYDSMECHFKFALRGRKLEIESCYYKRYTQDIN